MRVVLQERGTNKFTIYDFVHIVKTLPCGDIVLVMDTANATKLIDAKKFELIITN